MCGPSLRKVGQGAKGFWSYWSERKRLQTDRQTDRPTCAKQYALSSTKGGINIETVQNVIPSFSSVHNIILLISFYKVCVCTSINLYLFRQKYFAQMKVYFYVLLMSNKHSLACKYWTYYSLNLLPNNYNPIHYNYGVLIMPRTI